MAGVVSPVDVGVRAPRRRCTAARAWCSLNEGLGKVLRYGAYGPDVSSGCTGWPTCSARCCGMRCRPPAPVDITAIMAQMLQMGDEGHNRNRAGTLMLLRELLPALVDSPSACGGRRGGACGSSPATTTSSSTW